MFMLSHDNFDHFYIKNVYNLRHILVFVYVFCIPVYIVLTYSCGL